MSTAGRTSIPRLVGIELLKLRTTPGPTVTLGLTAVLVMVSVVSTVFLAGRQDTDPLDSVATASKVLAVGAVTAVVMLILGILISSAEDRHRTNIAAYLGEPRRGRVLVAKLVTAGLTGAAVGAVMFGVALALARVLYAVRGASGPSVDIGTLWVGTTLLTACFGLLGTALGALTRNTVAAIVAALAWVLVGELAVLQPLVPALAKWLPTGAARALSSVGPGQPQHLPPPLAALVLVGWALLIAGTAATVSLRREPR